MVIKDPRTMEKGHGALCAILGLDASQSEEKYRITELQDFGRSWEILGKVGRFWEKLGEVGRWVPNTLVLANTVSAIIVNNLKTPPYECEMMNGQVAWI
jgi:hypothetical protein